MDSFDKKLDSMIYAIFRMYGREYCVDQMTELKSNCINEINSHPELKEVLTDNKSIKYFIIQMTLENIK